MSSRFYEEITFAILMLSIDLYRVLGFLALQNVVAPLCGTGRAWPSGFVPTLDRGNGIEYVDASPVTFPLAKADGNVRYYLQLQAARKLDVAADSAVLSFEFWMNTELQHGAIPRAMYSVPPDTTPVRVTLDDTAHLSWIATSSHPWGQREQDAGSSVSESMFIHAPLNELARFVSSKRAVIQIRGRSLVVNESQLAAWWTIVRWAWCTSERPKAVPAT